MPVLTVEINSLALAYARLELYVVYAQGPNKELRCTCKGGYEVWVKGKCIYRGNSAVDACEWYNEENN